MDLANNLKIWLDRACQLLEASDEDNVWIWVLAEEGFDLFLYKLSVNLPTPPVSSVNDVIEKRGEVEGAISKLETVIANIVR